MKTLTCSNYILTCSMGETAERRMGATVVLWADNSAQHDRIMSSSASKKILVKFRLCGRRRVHCFGLNHKYPKYCQKENGVTYMA